MVSDTLKSCKLCFIEQPLNNYHCYNGFHRTECKECHKKLQKEAYRRNPDKWRDRQLRARYGMTLSEYTEMLANQDYKCKICSIEQNENVLERKLAVDHDHKTGKVRGLLCTRCNIAVGFIRDNPGWAEKAIVYLNKHHNQGQSP